MRCPRRSLVVLAGGPSPSDAPARQLERSLLELGLETIYAGRQDDPSQIADAAVREGADAIELCLAPGAAGVGLLRELLRQLIAAGRRDVSIVVHRAI